MFCHWCTHALSFYFLVVVCQFLMKDLPHPYGIWILNISSPLAVVNEELLMDLQLSCLWPVPCSTLWFCTVRFAILRLCWRLYQQEVQELRQMRFPGNIQSCHLQWGWCLSFSFPSGCLYFLLPKCCELNTMLMEW